LFSSGGTESATTHLIVNALGEDRLGIVSDMTKLVTNVGGSVADSQATKLGSYFSLTMTIDVPSSNFDDLTEALKDIKGLKTQYLRADEDIAARPRARIGYSGRFTLEGADNPNLVHKVTSLLVEHGLSVDALETSREEAAFGGTTLFSIDGIVTAQEPIPKSFNTDKIRKQLDKLGDSINCDVTLEDNVTRKSRPNYEIWENMA
jgi:glycine cleavage system transcriptional repressor